MFNSPTPQIPFWGVGIFFLPLHTIPIYCIAALLFFPNCFV